LSAKYDGGICKWGANEKKKMKMKIMRKTRKLPKHPTGAALDAHYIKMRNNKETEHENNILALSTVLSV
jgi:hypothetical protein